MSSAPKSIFFNRHRALEVATLGESRASGQEEDFQTYANEPPVRLEQVENFSKVQEHDIPGDLQLEIADQVFDPSLTWAYRGYIVHHLPTDESGQAARPAGKNRPPQPVSRAPAHAPADPARGGTAAGTGAHQAIETGRIPVDPAMVPEVGRNGRLYLFNVLVALEWAPDEEDLRQLMWAFRRASDFLYDVTDGWMAFGQVVFGGPQLMHCADIQIMASNRLLPRSWVAGMHEPDKYMPIRVGRGLWNDRNRVTIPWDEPEGYRTLIHEWSHYALHLRDAYQSKHDLVSAAAAGLAHVPDQLLVRARPGETPQYTAVIPSISLISESIMATLEGTSELVHHTANGAAQRAGGTASNTDDEWQTILATNRYPMLVDGLRTLEGPGRMPLPLPLFGRAGLPTVERRYFLPAQGDAAAPVEQLPAGTRLDHCWVYLLRNMAAGQPTLVAQGTLDARLIQTPFRLLGAAPGDTVVLIAEQRDQPPAVLRSSIAENGALADWEPATSVFPTVDVVPDSMGVQGQMARFSVRVQSAIEQNLPSRVWVFPLGQPGIDLGTPDVLDWSGTPPAEARLTLDGYVLLQWGDTGEQLLIDPFSQGGGPSTHTPGPANPITAGSSDGSALLFFHDDAKANGARSAKDYSRVKVITTIEHGLSGAPPEPGARARSYGFSVAGNEALPVGLYPTLVVYYDTPDERELLSGDLRVCRLEGGQWKSLPTYLPPGYPFAVVPLDQAAGATLLDPKATQRVEHYQVYWIPRQTGGGGGGQAAASA